MGATVNTLSQVKGLVAKIKQKENNIKDYNSANRALINKLLQMESAYKQKSASANPDYKRSISTEGGSLAPVIKSDNEIMQEASKYVSDLASENKRKIDSQANEKISKIESKGIKAYENQQEKHNKSLSDFNKNKDYITSKTIKQGLTHSSIKEDWQNKNLNEYLSAYDAIRADYNRYMDELGKEINMINSARTQSLSDYNLKLASEYERKLQQLKNEQIKAIEKLNSYNNLIERESNDNKQKQAEYEKELAEGYSGEKAVEMDNRYNEALNFYKSMDNKIAVKYIEENSEELKRTLGLYYTKLLEEIKNGTK